jgi:hypothetical protein
MNNIPTKIIFEEVVTSRMEGIAKFQFGFKFIPASPDFDREANFASPS